MSEAVEIYTVSNTIEIVDGPVDVTINTGGGPGGGVTDHGALTGLADNDHPQYALAASLGTMSTQSAASVAITGGTISGITDLAIADGGTGGSTAAAARTNLSVYSDAEVDQLIAETVATLQPLDATLTALAGWNWSSGVEVVTLTAADTRGVLRVGTGANNLVQLDGNGALPAVSGANLTNLPSSGGTEVCDTVETDTSVNGTNGSWTTLSGFSLTLPVGKHDISPLINVRLPSSGVSTQGRFLITTGTINEADGAPVGIFFPHGVASVAMVYTAATGVISGGVRSSDTTSVVFKPFFSLDVTSPVTLVFQHLTGTSTANQLTFQSTTHMKAKLLA